MGNRREGSNPSFSAKTRMNTCFMRVSFLEFVSKNIIKFDAIPNATPNKYFFGRRLKWIIRKSIFTHCSPAAGKREVIVDTKYLTVNTNPKK